MNLKNKKSLFGLLVIFVMILAVSFGLTSKKQTEQVANAAIEYEYAVFMPYDDQWYLFYACCNCGHEYFKTTDDPDDYEDYWDLLDDWEILSDYCRHCYEGHLCEECHDDLSDVLSCDVCNLCLECWDDSTHCHHCGSCAEDLCQECLEQEGLHICLGCHTEQSHCPGCGMCMYSLYGYGAVCQDYGEPHCIYCDEEWICNECGECFFNYQDKFCSECEMCIDCAMSVGLHCPYCSDCIIDVGGCEGLEGVCLGCCIDIGNHCELCDEHIGDEGTWCTGGQECGHCFNCADSEGWICSSCNRCSHCDDFEWCETCGLCEDCCHINAELEGCECGEYCVEDGSFEDTDHLCSLCGENFSCVVEFCEDCGLCIDCCLQNSEDAGCICGICIDSSDFEDHLCENCGLPTCAQGDICDDCGYCEECCLAESEAHGCSCGLCVESDDFNSPDHLCEECQENLSCNVDFCDSCGLCVECCERESEIAGCDHGICVESDDWEEHFCDTCNKCKEDCSCGEECCENPGGLISGTHGTPVAVGSILKQPTNKTRTVTKNTRAERSENLVTFSISAYDPNKNVTYQWYVVEGNKAPAKLFDDTEYIISRDETLIIVSGAKTSKVTIAVPANACSVSYSYYCVVTNTNNETFQSESAKLIGKHNYGYVWTSANGHSHGCVGCGEIEEHSEKPHEIGPWIYSHYATATQGALMVRECRVCGGVAESKTTESLGDHPYHIYTYTPIYVTDKQGNVTSTYHEKVCICGRKVNTKEEHVWSAWVITKHADEQHTGSKYHDCAVCNYRETVIIPKQTHDHVYCFDADESPTGMTSMTNYNNRYHWAYCVYPDCHSEAYKEEHQFDDWHIRDIPYNISTETDRLVWRTCKICGYEEAKEIKSGFKALVLTNATSRAQSVDNFEGESSVHTATAKAPKGYYFDHWEVVCPDGYTADDLFDFTWGYWKKWKLSDGSTKSEFVYTTIYDETVSFRLRHLGGESYNITYQLKAVCYRYDNELIVYPNSDKDDCYYLGEGDTIATNSNPSATGVSKQDSVVWVESIEENQFGWVIYYDGKDRGERTMTVHLNGYRGGPLELTSLEQGQGEGLPCNLHIIVDKDSVITTNGSGAIWGCSAGGNVIISSTNGSTLTIRVSGLNPYTGEVYGIHTDKAANGFNSKVSFQGNVKVKMYVTNQGGGYSQNSVAIGISTKTQVEVLDQASLYVQAISWDKGEDSKTSTAYAIQAGKELRINTTGSVELDVTGVRQDKEKKGQGVKAKAIYVDNVDHFYIDYNNNVRSGSNAKPQYNAKNIIEYTIDMSEFKRRVVEPGYHITFAMQQYAETSPIINVERWYQNDLGQYLVRRDANFSFSVIPALGYYDPTLFIDGLSLDGYLNKDGVTTSYIVYCIDSDVVINVYAGTEFNPYYSQPAVSQKNVYYLNDARLSYRLSGTEALYYHSLYGGEKSTDPKFKKDMDKYADPNMDPELITTNFTINKVFLQRYNSSTNTYKNTGIVFDASAVGEVTFNDGQKYVGETIRYRLVIVFDGKEYISESFTVTWTENQEDVPEPVANVVELHVKHFGYDNGKFDAGDGIITLDSENPYYIYCAKSNQSFRGDAHDLLYYQRSGKNPVIVAEFNYHTGTLTMNGTRYAVDFNGDGYITSDERINIDGEILSIRVADESSMGGLTINVLNNTHIGGSFDDYGWKGSNHYSVEAAINNEFGFVRVKSTNKEFSEPEFNINLTSKAHDIEGILSDGSVYIEGNIVVNITLSAPENINVSANGDRFGIYSNGNIIMRGNAMYTYNGLVDNKSKTLLGESVAVYSEYGYFKMFDNSYVVIHSSAKYKTIHGDYNAINVVGLSVVQNASMFIETTGDVNVPIYSAKDILFETTGVVRIRSMAEALNVYGVYCYEGKFEVHYPTTLIYETEYNTALMQNGEFVLVGKYTHYNKPGFDKYFPGNNYKVSVIIDDEMKYYFSQYDYEIAEPDTTVLKTGFYYQDFSQSVRVGDKVKIVAKEPKHGFTFNGWKIVCGTELQNLKYELDGRKISFTMPECSVELYPIYTCTAFDEKPIHIVVRDAESKYATLYWQLDASKNLTDAHLEKLENGKWVALDFKLTATTSIPNVSGKTTYKGEQSLKILGATGEGKELEAIGTYRISASSNDGYFANYNLFSEPFVIDFEGGLHILASEDFYDPTLAIPAGYTGTEYTLYISDYVYADYDLDYEFHFEPLSEAVDITLNGRIATIKRNVAHESVAANRGVYFKVIDNKTGNEYYIPFDFGEIMETTNYPVYVNGVQVNNHNMSDVLGDGTVSYNHETKTLTLSNAYLSNTYSKTIKYGGTVVGGYAILAEGQNLTVELVGNSIINVDSNSYCTNFDGEFDGEIIAIGNATTSSYSFPALTFTGTGSLVINVAGNGSKAIYSSSTVTIQNCDIKIHAEENGIVVENSSLELNSGKLTIDTEKKSAIELRHVDRHFDMTDGKLSVNGGTEDYAIKLATDGYIYLYKGSITLETKSTTFGVANVNIGYDHAYNDAYTSVDGENYTIGEADKDAKHIKFMPNIYIWVNGERITAEHLTVKCGSGSATFNLETRTLTLSNATITKGIAYYQGIYYATAIYSEEPITINFVGNNTINLSTRDFYDAFTGEKYTPADAEDEQYRQIIGIHISSAMISHTYHGFDDFPITLTGDSCKISGVTEGIESESSVTLLGANITVSHCEVGISTFKGLKLETGYVRITADKTEDSYAIYGDIIIGEHYLPTTIFGTDSGDLVRLDYAELTKKYENRWGGYYKSLWIRDYETSIDIYHDWGEATYSWSEDGTKLTATAVCKNDASHILTETVDVIAEVVVEPTCISKGKTKYTSKVFSNSVFKVQTRTLENIDIVEHTLTVKKENEVKATCTTEGHYDRVTYCSVCDEEFSRELQVIPVDENAHDFGEWVVTKAPTEYEYGVETRTCKHNHNHTESRYVNALGNSVRVIDVTKQNAEDGIDVKTLFDSASEDNQEVMIVVDDIIVTFDSVAVDKMVENSTINFSIVEEDAGEVDILGAQKVLNITVTGFTAGKSTVKVPFETEIPENRVGKVYYVDADGNKTDMNATFVNGMVIFETTHFSKYVIVLEEKIIAPDVEPENPETESSSAVVVIIIVLSVVVVAGAGVCVYFFVIKKKKSTPKTTDSTTTEQ